MGGKKKVKPARHSTVFARLACAYGAKMRYAHHAPETARTHTHHTTHTHKHALSHSQLTLTLTLAIAITRARVHSRTLLRTRSHADALHGPRIQVGTGSPVVDP